MLEIKHHLFFGWIQLVFIVTYFLWKLTAQICFCHLSFLSHKLYSFPEVHSLLDSCISHLLQFNIIVSSNVDYLSIRLFFNMVDLFIQLLNLQLIVLFVLSHLFLPFLVDFINLSEILDLLLLKSFLHLHPFQLSISLEFSDTILGFLTVLFSLKSIFLQNTFYFAFKLIDFVFIVNLFDADKRCLVILYFAQFLKSLLIVFVDWL